MKTEVANAEVVMVDTLCDVNSLLLIPSVAQRLLRAGYKRINKEQIKQRFAIEQVNEKLEKEESDYTCVLMSSKLDRYSNEVMPDRVIDDIVRAKRLGVNTFEVCWPEVMDKKMLDPIVIGTFLSDDEKATWDKEWFEISFWE